MWKREGNESPAKEKARPGKRGRSVHVLILLLGLGVIGFLWILFPDASLPEVERTALERVGERLHLKGTQEPFTGILVTYYEDGELKARTEVRDGLLHGLSEGWYPDGTPEIREPFRKGRSHGTRVRWHPNGTMASRARIVDGELHGLFERWHDNGSLHQEIHMVEGQAHGPSRAFYPSGYLQAVVEMEKGSVLNREFWEDGEKRWPGDR
ncbi:MAG: toxin-antitoxin system YwqK family antitoxin [Oceanipulchritudo sp.]